VARFVQRLRRALGLIEIEHAVKRQTEMSRDAEVRVLLAEPKRAAADHLNRFEHQIFSQSGEDGILREIFRRLGISHGTFVEFGIGDGLENNTAALLLQGWSGLWMDGSQESVDSVRLAYREIIASGRLKLHHGFVSSQTIETLLGTHSMAQDFDLLSIDIDGNDYWVWKAIRNYRPKVAVIEYNAIFPPGLSWTIAESDAHRWQMDSHMGASLEALWRLGREKGYCLVGCNLAGVNAFFVRADLAGERFGSDFSCDLHYEPPRYHLISKSGHRRAMGPFVNP
jgi:hypothetical protein